MDRGEGYLHALAGLMVATREMNAVGRGVVPSEEAKIRQEMFNILAAEWLGKPVPLSEQDFHGALKCIQSFRRKSFPSVSPSRYSSKLLAQTYWFEVGPIPHSAYLPSFLTLLPRASPFCYHEFVFTANN